MSDSFHPNEILEKEYQEFLKEYGLRDTLVQRQLFESAFNRGVYAHQVSGYF